VDATELASRTGTSAARIAELARAGVLAPSADGSFDPADINRVRIAESLIAEGFALDDITRLLSINRLSFAPIDGLLASLMALDTRTLDERVQETGSTIDQLARLYEIWGLARPEPGQTAREDELELLRVLDGFRAVGIDPDQLVDATRYVGEATRRIAEGQVQFFRARVIEPLVASGMPMDEVIERAIPVGGQLQPNAKALVAWLHARHFENAIVQNLITMMETAMQQMGVEPATHPSPPAIAFVDLSGYTSETERGGDQEGSRLAFVLGEIVHHAATAGGGRVVKLIGDGAMLHFGRPADAVRAVANIVRRADQARIPPARAGVHAGDVIARDGDFFGRTVNIAARIQDHASPREVLVSGDVVMACEGQGLTFGSLGRIGLKGIAGDVEVHRLLLTPTAPSVPDR
jgi:adenylate cyclase